jgi:phosphoribosylamine---glycine ligase
MIKILRRLDNSLSLINILILGNYPRGYAFAKAAKDSTEKYGNQIIGKIHGVGSNDGLKEMGLILSDLNINNNEEVLQYCKDNNITFVISDSEEQISNGLVTFLHEHGIYMVGPTAETAWVEDDKVRSRVEMDSAGVPCPEFAIVESKTQAIEIGKEYISKYGGLFFKKPMLHGGKGANFIGSEEKLIAHATEWKEEYQSKNYKLQALIEEPMIGFEFSSYFICGVDKAGNAVYAYDGAAEDYKYTGVRIKDSSFFVGQKGEVTGGMASVAPSFIQTEKLLGKVKNRCVDRFLKYMHAQGTPFHGYLYVGGMAVFNKENKEWDFQIVEFNMRDGDPEAVARNALRETDIIPYLLASTRHPEYAGFLAELPEIKFSNKVALNIVFASEGYPGKYKKDVPVKVSEELRTREDIIVYYGPIKDGKTAGSRCLEIVILADNLELARAKIPEVIAGVDWPGVQVNVTAGDRVETLEKLNKMGALD